jgi:hypothetical protein
MAALRNNSSLSSRLRRYNHHMNKARALVWGCRMNRYQALSNHHDSLTLGVECLSQLNALCRVLWQREKARVPASPQNAALMLTAMNQAGWWCDRLASQATEMARTVEQYRAQDDGGGSEVAVLVECHRNDLNAIEEVCTRVHALCAELINDKKAGVLARLACEVTEDALCDWGAIAFDLPSPASEAPGTASTLNPPAPDSEEEADPARDLVERIARLYSGEALPNDPTELVITGHDVWLAQQARAGALKSTVQDFMTAMEGKA